MIIEFKILAKALLKAFPEFEVAKCELSCETWKDHIVHSFENNRRKMFDHPQVVAKRIHLEAMRKRRLEERERNNDEEKEPRKNKRSNQDRKGRASFFRDQPARMIAA